MHRWTCALLLPLLCAPAFAGTPLPDAPHVAVEGRGEVSVAPDWALVSMEARKRSTDPAEAKRVVDRAVDSLLEVAPQFDIEPDDVTASDLEIDEDIEYDDDDRPTSREHVAKRTVKVRIDDLDRLGAWIDAALGAGFTNIENVEFKSSKEADLRAEAQRAAVQDAKQKATDFATAFGGRLGPVYSINSASSSQFHGYGNTELDRIQVTGTRINNGRYLQPKIDFSARVSAVFEISR